MHSTTCLGLASGMLATKDGDEMSQAASKLVVLAEREFTRGCLSYWLRACCPDLDVLVAADLGDIHSPESEGPPASIVVYASGCDQTLEWIEQQMAAKSRLHKSTPTVLICNGFDPDLAQDLVRREVVDAIIPTSDTTEIAAAALRLVLAGGHYMPRLVPAAASSRRDPGGAIHHELPVTLGGDLTARERAVLELLKTGKPNKVIAHKLGMSLSTAKVHVHNIIRKLKVRNRTEAVIAAGKFNMPHNQFVQTAAKAGHLDLDLASGKGAIEIAPNLANHYVVSVPRVRAKAY